METRRRTNLNANGAMGGYGEKESVMGMGMEEKELIQDDGDSGKWGKGYGVGPGYGGRRGLPPRQKRIPGWVGLIARPCTVRSVLALTKQKGQVVEHEEWVWTAVYTILSMLTRFWRIGAANYVVWDEVSHLPGLSIVELMT